MKDISKQDVLNSEQNFELLSDLKDLVKTT